MCRCMFGWFKNQQQNQKKFSNREIPLKSGEIHASIKDLSAKVTITQRFVNSGTETLELSYNFELPKGAAVCSFVAEIEGKKIRSVLKEKEQAKNEYDDALASGHGAYLSEKKEDGTFQSSIGSLQPGTEVLLIMEYVTELVYDDEGSSVLFQLMKNKTVNDIDNDNPTKESELKMTVDVQMSKTIQKIQSLSHTIEVDIKEGNKEARITFKDLSHKSSSKGAELSIAVSESYQPTSNVEQIQGSDEVTVALSFHPDLKKEESLDEVNTEFIFLVDCSGSMRGAPMDAVKQTLHIFLRSLPESCYFNIVDFGTSHKSLFIKPTKYDESSLQKAIINTNAKAAILGGTNLLGPLQSILSQKPTKGYSRQVFLLTDGQVSNNSDCINEVSRNAQNTRVFTFGIGNSVDVSLVTDIAKESNGMCELLPTGSNFEEIVMRQLIRACKPAISDLVVKVDGISEQQAQITPFHPPPVYSGDRVVLYMQFDPELSVKGPLVVALSGMIGQKPFTQSISVDLSSRSKVDKQNSLLYQLYGFSAITDLEKKTSFLHNADGSLSSGVTEQTIIKKTIETSLKSGILCKETAFVAIEEREGETANVSVIQNLSSKEPQQQRVTRTPHHLPQRRASPVLLSRGRSAPTEEMKKEKNHVSRKKSSFSEEAPSPRTISKPMSSSLASSSSSKGTLASNTPAVNLPVASQLVQCQNANGSFKESSLTVMGITQDQLKNSLPQTELKEAMSFFLVAVVCAYFELKCQKEQTSWTLVVKKARNWMRKELEKLNFSTELFESAAVKFVSEL
eukprot:TRINITY_DN1840_c0_g1_i1.p1 TRINITY_DN1840_c0_g1~~TRINITY_DN1840_c0_g1_i1.p1  ORF type:complete len:821 (-),score=233.18 TRINITY_DN1840_c0_g1_i1:83-2461(-)